MNKISRTTAMPMAAIDIANHDSWVTDRRSVSPGRRASCVVRGSKPALVLTGDSVVSLVVSFVVFVVLSFVVSLVVSVVVSLIVSFVVSAVVEMKSIAVVFVVDVDVSGETVSTVVFVVVVEAIVILDVSGTDAVDTGVEVFT